MNKGTKLALGAIGLAGILVGSVGVSTFIFNTRRYNLLEIKDVSGNKLEFSDKRPNYGYFNIYNGNTYFVLDTTGDKNPDELFIIRGVTYADTNKAWQALREKIWDRYDFSHYVAADIERERQYIRSGREIRVSREKLFGMIPTPPEKGYKNKYQKEL